MVDRLFRINFVSIIRHYACVCVRRTGGLSVCLSLLVELMFDQGQNDGQKYCINPHDCCVFTDRAVTEPQLPQLVSGSRAARCFPHTAGLTREIHTLRLTFHTTVLSTEYFLSCHTA